MGFREIAVRALTDAPVTVTGVDVGREGDGVSYLSLGFPGATVQCLQRLTTENLADDLRRMAPDYVVLSFGTNEGFNDNLDIASYVAQYEQIVHRLMEVRPGVRVIIVGPPDAARPAGACHAAGVGQDCTSAAPPGRRGPRRRAVPGPDAAKLGAVRDAHANSRNDWRDLLGLVVGHARPVRRAGLGGRHSAADGARLRAHDAGRL